MIQKLLLNGSSTIGRNCLKNNFLLFLQLCPLGFVEIHVITKSRCHYSTFENEIYSTEYPLKRALE